MRMEIGRYWYVHRKRYLQQHSGPSPQRRREGKFFMRKLRRGDEKCPRCSADTVYGFGLMGGGYGPYWACVRCGFFHKVRLCTICDAVATTRSICDACRAQPENARAEAGG